MKPVDWDKSTLDLLAEQVLRGEVSKAQALETVSPSDLDWWARYGMAQYLDRAVRVGGTHAMRPLTPERELKLDRAMRASSRTKVGTSPVIPDGYRENSPRYGKISERAAKREDARRAAASRREEERKRFQSRAKALKTAFGPDPSDLDTFKNPTPSEVRALFFDSDPLWLVSEVTRYYKQAEQVYAKAQMKFYWEEYEHTVTLRVTETLLSQTFALPDGSRVFWGSASIEQHEERIQMLERHAEGTITTAGLHRAAIDQINDVGGSCLRDTLI